MSELPYKLISSDSLPNEDGRLANRLWEAKIQVTLVRLPIDTGIEVKLLVPMLLVNVNIPL